MCLVPGAGPGPGQILGRVRLGGALIPGAGITPAPRSGLGGRALQIVDFTGWDICVLGGL